MSKILLIDDKSYIRTITSKALEGHGHEVITTDRGIDGIKIAKYFQPDLILMDIRMPELSGVEASMRIRDDSVTAHIPIIVLSAFADREVMDPLNKIGIDRIIDKPYEIDDLLSKIDGYLHEHAANN